MELSCTHRRQVLLLLIFLLAIAYVPSLNAQGSPQFTTPSGIQRVTSLEGVTEYRLANGLRVLLFPDTSTPNVTVNVTYLVGSRNESYGETGMAHLLEHLMFKGTPSHPNIYNELTERSSDSFGTNAMTTADYTTYFETLAGTQANLKWALDLEADRMINSFISKKDLESEMTVVRNEFERGENDPRKVLSEHVSEAAFTWHNYRHPTIGSRADIENVPIERLQAFYRTYYQPDNAVLTVVGEFDEQKALEYIQGAFGAIRKPDRPLPQVYTEEPTQDGQHEVILRRTGSSPMLIAAYHVPAVGHPDTVALRALAGIVGDRETGRLYKRLIETKLATEVGVDITSGRDPGLIEFSAIIPDGGDIYGVRDELLKALQSLVQEPVTETELKRYQNRMAEAWEKWMITLLPSSISLGLSSAAAQGDWRLYFWGQDEIQKVTLADMQRAAAKYLVPSNLTLGVFIPDDKPVRASVPPTPDYQAVLRDYRGKPPIAQGEPFERTPSNIEARTTRLTIGSIKLALLPKKNRGDQVTGVLEFHFGDEQSLRGRNKTQISPGGLLMQGTTKHDKVQLQDELLAQKTDMSVNGGPSSISVNFQTDRGHLVAALRLAAEGLQHPAFPVKEFEELKRRELTGAEAERAEPNAIVDRALERALSPYPSEHIAYVPTLDESIKRLNTTTLEEVKKFYRDFYGIGSAEMVLVGDFDDKEVAGLIKELFGSWKSRSPYKRVIEVYKPVVGKTEVFKTPDKENAVFQVATNLEIRDDDPAYPALLLGVRILGGGFLNSRLAARLRQKEGLSYGVSSDLWASAQDRVGGFEARAICAPQNEEKVAKAFQEELAQMLASGVTAEELTVAKTAYLQSQKELLADDRAIADTLASFLYQGRDLHWIEQVDQRVAAVTPEQVRQAMRQYIDPSRLIVMTAGDFDKAREK